LNALADRLHRERDYTERENHGQTETETERQSTTARREGEGWGQVVRQELTGAVPVEINDGVLVTAATTGLQQWRRTAPRAGRPH
jgi:hypothetical protein